MSAALLQIEGLCKDFVTGSLGRKRIRVLHDVDLDVQRGETHGIAGESGSGKTTLARCSLRLIKPSAGSVRFDGQDLATLKPSVLRNKRREFQMVFQDPFASLNPGMTVRQILLEPLEVQQIGSAATREERICELLDSVSLSRSFLDHGPAELSGGQQQRVGIARALATHPRLLIADEPVSALDPSVQVQVLNLLADLKVRHGLTLILISHSLESIHYLCSSVSIMYQGRIVEEAPVPAFFGGPKHPYSRLLLSCMSDSPDQGNRKAHSGLAVAEKIQHGCLFQPHCCEAKAICRQQIPALTETGSGEKVACFLYGRTEPRP
jgi:peptide/nickel transport system ATP-binding protein/oligopeptide transport system ATP-binding protein